MLTNQPKELLPGYIIFEHPPKAALKAEWEGLRQRGEWLRGWFCFSPFPHCVTTTASLADSIDGGCFRPTS